MENTSYPPNILFISGILVTMFTNIYLCLFFHSLFSRDTNWKILAIPPNSFWFLNSIYYVYQYLLLHIQASFLLISYHPLLPILSWSLSYDLHIMTLLLLEITSYHLAQNGKYLFPINSLFSSGKLLRQEVRSKLDVYGSFIFIW